MTVKTTLSFTDRHHHFLSEKVGQGVFASQSAAVAAALEQMMQDEEEREVALSALGQEVRARMETSRAAFIDQDDAFAAARSNIGAWRVILINWTPTVSGKLAKNRTWFSSRWSRFGSLSCMFATIQENPARIPR